MVQLDALNMAVAQRRPTTVIHHSDQGCQYTSIKLGGSRGEPQRVWGGGEQLDSLGTNAAGR